MQPTLDPGDLVWVQTRFRGRPPLGSLVVVRDPADGKPLVKRVSSHGATTFSVASDAPFGSRDSRTFGSLGRDALVGVVRVSFSLRDTKLIRHGAQADA